LLRESSPGHADDPEAGFDEVGVFGAVGLEVVVELFAVELGDEPLLRPVRVDLVARDDRVDLRAG